MSICNNPFTGPKDEGVGSVALQFTESNTLPLRLSVLQGDPNYTPNARDYNVYLDDVKQSRCIVADAENGYVLRYKKTILGTLSKDREGKFKTEEVFGNVVIEKRK